MSSSLGVVLHLSDMHFGKCFNDIGCGAYNRVRTNIMSFATDGSFKFQKHDPDILSCLNRDIYLNCKTLGLDYPFACVVSGDIHTSAEHTAAYNDFSFPYLTSDFTIDGGSPVGLKFAENRLICVPGNHDAMLMKHCMHYEQSRFCNLETDTIRYIKNRNQGFLFCTIDSNFYEVENFALGHICGKRIDRLKSRLENIRYGQSTEIELDSEDYHNSIRILVIHHSLKKRIRWYERLRNKDELSKLKNDIHLILCGHRHVPTDYYFENMCVVEGGTVSELSRESKKNHFCLIHFFKENDLIFCVPYQIAWDTDRRMFNSFEKGDTYQII